MENLVKWRKQNGVTQSAFANRLGISNSALAKYEKGRLRLKPELAMRIEVLTGGELSAANLLGLKRQMGVREIGVVYDTAAIAPDMKSNYASQKAADPKLKQAHYDAWLEENRESFAANALDIEQNGLWCDRYRLF